MIKTNEKNYLGREIRIYYLFIIGVICLFGPFPLYLFSFSFSYVLDIIAKMIIIFGLPVYLYLLAKHRSFNFYVYDNRITINSGILKKSSKIIPFASIQKILSEQNAIDQAFNLASVAIWTGAPAKTAAQESGDGNLPEVILKLNKNDAQQLVNHILQRR